MSQKKSAKAYFPGENKLIFLMKITLPAVL